MMESKKKRLTQARLKEMMIYDPGTGVFVRKVGAGPTAIGNVAGTLKKDGYLKCQIDGQQYYCHRLAWLFVHGYMPEHGLDHINRDTSDNRIENLREASQQCNVRNSRQRTGTSSGVKGVHWHKAGGKWVAQICVNGKVHKLGLYKSKDNAVSARLAAEQCLGWAGCDSNSPAYQYVQNMLSGV